jgi:hypothetical protein
LPPGLADDDGTDPQVTINNLQGQVAQMNQHMQQATALINQQHQIIETKQVEAKSKENIAQMQEMSKQAIVKMQEATKISVAQINASKDANEGFADRELEQYKILHDAAHDVAMQAVDQDHQKDMAAQAAANAQQTQQADQTHDLGMAAVNAAQQPQNGDGE